MSSENKNLDPSDNSVPTEYQLQCIVGELSFDMQDLGEAMDRIGELSKRADYLFGEYRTSGQPWDPVKRREYDNIQETMALLRQFSGQEGSDYLDEVVLPEQPVDKKQIVGGGVLRTVFSALRSVFSPR